MAAAALAFGAWNWHVRDEAARRVRRAEELETREQALCAGIAESGRLAGQLTQALQEASNRIDQLEGLLEEEKSTHDPLRHQIEAMLSEQIGLREVLKQKDALLKKHDEAVVDARRADQETQTKQAALAEKIVRLETDLKAAADRESAARTQLVDVQRQAAATQAALDETRKRLESSEQKNLETGQTHKDAASSVPDATGP